MKRKSSNARICIEMEREISKIHSSTGLEKTKISKIILNGYLNNKNNNKNKGLKYENVFR